MPCSCTHQHAACVHVCAHSFVADHINGRVVVFNAGTMEHVRTFGSCGEGDGELSHPMGIAISATEEVFIADSVRMAGAGIPCAAHRRMAL